MCADAAVDDDTSTLRLLLLHVSKGFTGAKPGSGQVDVDGSLPVGQLLFCQRYVGRRDAGVAENEIDSAELLSSLLEDAENDILFGDVTGNEVGRILATSSLGEEVASLLQLGLTSTGDGDVPASACQSYSARSSQLCGAERLPWSQYSASCSFSTVALISYLLLKIRQCCGKFRCRYRACASRVTK